MRLNNSNITELLKKELQEQQFEKERDIKRIEAKEQIIKFQEDNRRTYNLRRKKHTKYKLGDLVAIKRCSIRTRSKIASEISWPVQDL